MGNKYFVINNCDWNVKEDEEDIFICINGKAGAIINLMDKLKSNAKDVVNYLKNMGIKVILATGDPSKNAEEITRE